VQNWCCTITPIAKLWRMGVLDDVRAMTIPLTKRKKKWIFWRNRNRNRIILLHNFINITVIVLSIK
jgi:hypothetical protein